ncbi:MAG: hypothetical protein OIF51_16105, partial [Cellvibrionaceae bacterium]|nr:hypothetical protein [Cellvibrionaceae bacterium]
DAFGNAIGNSMVGAHKAAANEARMEQALKEQARQRIASHYKTKGMALRGDKHYNDVISQYNGWDPVLAAELALPDRIRGYGDAWDTGLAADYALPNRIRMYGIGNSEPEYIAKYGDPSAWKVPTVSSDPDNREVSADNDLVRELSFATNFSSVSLGAGLLVQQPLGKVNDWTKGFTMHQFMPAGHLQTPSYHSINGQIIDGAEWIFDSGKFVMPLDFSSGALNDGLDTSGRWLSGAGLGLSIYSAFEGTFLNEEAYLAGDVKDMSVWTKEWGKVGVDGLAAATSFAPLARFSPIGLAYTAADLTVQYTPSYTIRHGQYAGDTSDGWSKLLYMSSDQQIDVKSVSEKAYHELYLKRMPKY